MSIAELFRAPRSVNLTDEGITSAAEADGLGASTASRPRTYKAWTRTDYRDALIVLLTAALVIGLIRIMNDVRVEPPGSVDLYSAAESSSSPLPPR